MSGKPALCGVCRRQIQLRGDGRLRAHLAPGSTPGRRQQCDGSGGYSARVELAGGGGPHLQDTPAMSRAEAFNAREAWFAVQALYDELQSMKAAHSASWRAVAMAEDAYRRAHADARALAEWWDVQAHDDADDAA
jgi:hypothetical protein